MNRLILLHHPAYAQSIDGFSSISIQDLDKIVNHSIDHVYCSTLELYTLSAVEEILSEMLTKLRPNGLITLNITNMKNICREYYNGSMKDSTLLQNITNKVSILSQNSIKQILKKYSDIKIIKIESSDNLHTNITAQRIKI
jgi:predicted SAM-dependent methyltransferase